MIASGAAQLRPYAPGEQPREPGLIKLNTNESARAPSPRVAQALRTMLDDDGDALRRYPDPMAGALKQALGDLHGLASAQVFVGNGSDEVLGHCFAAFLAGRQNVLVPQISYGFYDSLASLFRVALARAPLDDHFDIRTEDYLVPGTGGVIFPNPNAPTGRLLPLERVAMIAAAYPDRVVIVDEAYSDFAGQTAIPLIAAHPNLVVVQTFSKSRGLAGLRVGMAFGSMEAVAALEVAKNCFNSYPLGQLAQVGALASLEDTAWLREHIADVVAQRSMLTETLIRAGFQVVPSSANFLIARYPGLDGAALYRGLRARGILVRHFDQPRVRDHLRITIGSAGENAVLLDALAALLERQHDRA